MIEHGDIKFKGTWVIKKNGRWLYGWIADNDRSFLVWGSGSTDVDAIQDAKDRTEPIKLLLFKSPISLIEPRVA